MKNKDKDIENTSSLPLKRKQRVDEENTLPIKVLLKPGDPNAGTKNDQKKLLAGKSLEGVCKIFEEKCSGGGRFPNNCAHYLSNAFILAGYSELNQSQNCVGARCNERNICDLGDHLNHRIIRAKELRCWFASNATKETSVTRGTGFWAVYQERASDGQGHVVIIDTNTWKYYGTGWYSDWNQEYYQW